MGVTFQNSVVVGVLLSDLVHITEKTETVNVYDENICKLYAKQITTCELYFLGEFVENLRELESKLLELKLYNTGSPSCSKPGKGWQRYNFSQYVVGMAIATTNEPEVLDFSSDDVNQKIKEVSGKLKKICGRKMSPKLYLVSSVFA